MFIVCTFAKKLFITLNGHTFKEFLDKQNNYFLR